MRFTITTGQIAFFKKFGFIEFEQLLPEPDCQKMTAQAAAHFSKKLKGSWDTKSLSESIPAGRDIWRENSHFAELVSNRFFAKIASQLSAKPLRLLFDQLFHTPENQLTLDPFFATPKKLQELSSFQGMSIGLLLKLTDSPTPPAAYPPNLTEPFPLFPWLKGSGIFIEGERCFQFDPIFSEPGQSYLLIVYGAIKTVYMPNPHDPSNIFLKKAGYGAGDLLKEETHPTLFQG